MKPKIFFERESPDFNIGLWGKPGRIVVNRVIICTMTEFGMINDRRMTMQEYSYFIETQQMIGIENIKTQPSMHTTKDVSKKFQKDDLLLF